MTVIAAGGYSERQLADLRDDLGEIHVLDTLDGLDTLSAEVVAGCTALAYKTGAPLGGEQMDRLPKLGLIANFGVGYDAIDIGAADARGIKVTNTPDVLTDEVADLAVTMFFAHGRDLIGGHRFVQDGRWQAGEGFPLQRRVSGRRAGIVGLGRIGRAIADRLAAFGNEIHYSSRSEKDTPGWTYHADPVSLAAAVDDLFVALVGGPDTEGHVSREVIGALGADGVIVNISRGTTIDEAALLDALEDGTIRGAALDVFVGEPKVDPRFLKLSNVLMQPHVGSATVETRAAMAKLQRDNVAAFLKGAQLLTPVN